MIARAGLEGPYNKPAKLADSVIVPGEGFAEPGGGGRKKVGEPAKLATELDSTLGNEII